MKILRDCTEILTLLGLGTSKSVEIVSMKIPRWLIQYSIIISLSVCVLSAIQFCHQNITEHIKILLPSAVVFTFFLQILIYISLLMKSGEIVELIGFLNALVNRREYIWPSKFYSKPFQICFKTFDLQKSRIWMAWNRR